MSPKDEYYTPEWVFDKLGLQFDLDPCSPGKNKCSSTATVHYSHPQNGLELEWRGRIWMNPPYSKPTPWVDKFIEHNNGIALLPFFKSNWFTRIWNAADGIALMPTTLKFQFESKNASISHMCALFALGETNAKALHNLESRIR